jgi:NADH-quinone oxidoreductase subunit C
VTYERARELLQAHVGVDVTGTPPVLTASVARDRWTEVAALARHTLGCNFFAFLTAVDWQAEGLEVVARVENLDVPFAVHLRTRLSHDDPACPSLVEVYRGADWMERECFDMFGVRFAGHPDLRRILLPDDWSGHPLLKSYDLDTPYPPYR